jgi:hypothetical protein
MMERVESRPSVPFTEAYVFIKGKLCVISYCQFCDLPSGVSGTRGLW